MAKSTLAMAFIFLGGLLVVGTAGIAAVDASHDSTTETLSDAGESRPSVLDMGEDVQAAVLTALPWVALAAVPIGIVGLLSAVSIGLPSGNRRARR
jgi:hypothetical protein